MIHAREAGQAALGEFKEAAQKATTIAIED